MAVSELLPVEAKLLAQIQRNFPLVKHPFKALSERLNVEEDHVMELIRGLKDQGLIRQISPVIDGRKLGYQSTLVAAEVPQQDLDKADRALRDHPRISHAYERDNALNVWFTLSVNAEADLEGELAELRGKMGAVRAFSLPALKLFKIGAFFGSEIDVEEPAGSSSLNGLERCGVSAEERKVVDLLQQDLELVHAPFDTMAAEAGITTTAFLSHCQSLVRSGVIRRFGASVNHRKAGYEGNGMACWHIPSEAVQSVGKQLAAIEAVSHCYERLTNDSWRYNIFAMFHGGTPETCRAVVEDAAHRIGIPEYMVLFSTREIKKTRVKYTA